VSLSLISLSVSKALKPKLITNWLPMVPSCSTIGVSNCVTFSLATWVKLCIIETVVLPESNSAYVLRLFTSINVAMHLWLWSELWGLSPVVYVQHWADLNSWSLSWSPLCAAAISVCRDWCSKWAANWYKSTQGIIDLDSSKYNS
jgi:hypothetical protein